MLEADRNRIQSRASRRLRAQLVTLCGIARAKFSGARSDMPSYMVTAIEGVFTALDRWSADEVTIEQEHAEAAHAAVHA